MRQLYTDVSKSTGAIAYVDAHTDDGEQLVARCREAHVDGGAGGLFVGSVGSFLGSLPLLVVVGGHCEEYADANAGCAFLRDCRSKLFTKASRPSPAFRPVQSHAAWPVPAAELSLL